MSRHLQSEIEKLKKKILALSAQVEQNVHNAVRAVANRDAKLARQVVEADYLVDQAEVEVEEECLKVLALHQPVAVDLRFIIALLKINNDLERIGDLAVNIAERAGSLSIQPPVDAPFDFVGMATIVESMLKRSLDALVQLDPDIARSVGASDDEVDEINRGMYQKVKDGIRRNPEHVDSYITLLSISRHLERIADHTTNIAEDVLYLTEGEIVRHVFELRS
jgi:phosphate transport system protein